MFGSIPTSCRRTHEEIIPLTRNNWWKCHKGFYWTPEASASVSKICSSYFICYMPYAYIRDFPLARLCIMKFLFVHIAYNECLMWKSHSLTSCLSGTAWSHCMKFIVRSTMKDVDPIEVHSSVLWIKTFLQIAIPLPFQSLCGHCSVGLEVKLFLVVCYYDLRSHSVKGLMGMAAAHPPSVCLI